MGYSDLKKGKEAIKKDESDKYRGINGKLWKIK